METQEEELTAPLHFKLFVPCKTNQHEQCCGKKMKQHRKHMGLRMRSLGSRWKLGRLVILVVGGVITRVIALPMQ